MNNQQVILLIINIVGGAAVIGSYIFGLRSQAGGATVLWGGVPANIRPVIGVSMILAAVGYLSFLYYLLLRITPDNIRIAGSFGFSTFYIIFLLILIPSAFWMPLTNLYASNPNPDMWIAIRVVLFVVGLSALALVLALVNMQPKTLDTAYRLAVAGSIYFTFHTLILDAILWATLFK
jgi:hypothetical protein